MVTALACGIEDVAEMNRGTKDWYDRMVNGAPIVNDPNAWRVRLAYLYEAKFGFIGATEPTAMQKAILSDLGKQYVPKNTLNSFEKEMHILEAKASPAISRPTRDAERASPAHQAAVKDMVQQRLAEARGRVIVRCSVLMMHYTKAKLHIRYECVVTACSVCGRC
jgi:hypothetical protein